ncbi:MAG: MogA/MoaB family molybdenum cofactor biosynthesis protein [Actinobacteria bacterium]|nr:MogA/MoaB family molybdenum cofactor biosynthesis protein [Actinomycetota bacterium]
MTHSGAVVTVSDAATRGDRVDTSGDEAERLLGAIGIDVVERRLVADELSEIVAVLTELSDGAVDVVVTTGGTGLSPRDVTPEATGRVIEREAPGLAELIRSEGTKKTPYASLSRGIAGIRKQTLIINLPGSTKAVSEGLEVLSPILSHGLDTLTGRTEHG